MKKSIFLLFAMAASMSVAFVACKKTPAPTVAISAAIDGYTVTFNPTVTDVDTYSWDFGDNLTSTETKPVHTYAKSGTYTVTLTVKGGGGTAVATDEITIVASFSELLTGGPSATNGKTWILSTAVTSGDGLYGVTTAMDPILFAFTDNFLNTYSFEAEYDNEFTFYDDGTYKMDPKNGHVLAGALYGMINGIVIGEPVFDIEMCIATFSPPASATWTVHNDDLTVDAITDPETSDIPPAHANVTFTGKPWISLSAGAYFGVLDFPTTAKFIVKDIAADKMNVILFNCEYGYDEQYMTLPTHLVQLTYIPKSAK